jgi:hypothetical protein
MSVSALNARALQDETAAYAWVEARLWPEGPVCPHCGGVDRISKMQGKSTRIGTYKCYQWALLQVDPGTLLTSSVGRQFLRVCQETPKAVKDPPM